jgi:hypothetical protein
LKPERDTWSETWCSIAKTVALGFEEAKLESVEFSWSEYLTSSTSYLARASSALTGRPDQMTSSGSIGGMKRVVLEDWMS